MKPENDKKRRARLAVIHMAKKYLALEDADYRHILSVNYGVQSAGDLSLKDMDDLITWFKKRGFQGDKPKGRKSKPQVPKERQPLINKIGALLADKAKAEQRPIGWNYAEGILYKQCGQKFLNWATIDQLEKVAQALIYDQMRRKKRACLNGV